MRVGQRLHLSDVHGSSPVSIDGGVAARRSEAVAVRDAPRPARSSVGQPCRPPARSPSRSRKASSSAPLSRGAPSALGDGVAGQVEHSGRPCAARAWPCGSGRRSCRPAPACRARGRGARPRRRPKRAGRVQPMSRAAAATRHRVAPGTAARSAACSRLRARLEAVQGDVEDHRPVAAAQDRRRTPTPTRAVPGLAGPGCSAGPGRPARRCRRPVCGQHRRAAWSHRASADQPSPASVCSWSIGPVRQRRPAGGPPRRVRPRRRLAAPSRERGRDAAGEQRPSSSAGSSRPTSCTQPGLQRVGGDLPLRQHDQRRAGFGEGDDDRRLGGVRPGVSDQKAPSGRGRPCGSRLTRTGTPSARSSRTMPAKPTAERRQGVGAAVVAARRSGA